MGKTSELLIFSHVVKSSYFSDQQIQADMNLRVTVIDEAHDNKIYNLTFPGSHTVVQVGWQHVTELSDDLSRAELSCQDEKGNPHSLSLSFPPSL